MNTTVHNILLYSTSVSGYNRKRLGAYADNASKAPLLIFSPKSKSSSGFPFQLHMFTKQTVQLPKLLLFSDVLFTQTATLTSSGQGAAH